MIEDLEWLHSPVQETPKSNEHLEFSNLKPIWFDSTQKVSKWNSKSLSLPKWDTCMSWENFNHEILPWLWDPRKHYHSKCHHEEIDKRENFPKGSLEAHRLNWMKEKMKIWECTWNEINKYMSYFFNFTN